MVNPASESPQRMFNNVLFISKSRTLSYNFSGAAALCYSHLQLLRVCLPDARIHILFVSFTEKDVPDSSVLERDFQGTDFQVHHLNFSAPPAGRLTRWQSLLRSGINRLRFFYTFLSPAHIRQFRQTVQAIGPDLIWSEHLVENFLALQSGVRVPIVYSHHDFLWKIRIMRQGKNWRNYLFHQAEIALIQQNTCIVSGSASELREITQINPQAVVAYLPPHYPSVAVNRSVVSRKPGIVHVGGLSITANRIGLKRFLEVAWPVIIRKHSPELRIIGRANDAPEDVKALLQQYGIQPLGFVDDLSTVLQPYDIHVIPYEGDTGVRTRLPLALNYNQLVISIRNSSQGTSGLVHSENCLLAENLEEMSQYIVRILDGQLDYRTIADNGKRLFEQAFTVASQKTEMMNLIKVLDKSSM